MSIKNTIEGLKECPQWVCAAQPGITIQTKKGPKVTEGKEPLNPHTNGFAQPNNSSTWDTFKHAYMRWKKEPERILGIGFNLVKSQCLTCVDLDKCIDKDGKLKPWARKIVDMINSYTEYSPSVTGLHIWAFGKIPNIIPADPDGRVNVEMYDHDHYMTVTNKHFDGTPKTIEDRQGILLELHMEVTEQRRQAATEAKEARRKFDDQSADREPLKGTASDTPYGLKALQDECAIMSSTTEGGRDKQLNKSAYAMGQIIAHDNPKKRISRETVEKELRRSALETGLDGDVIDEKLDRVIADGMDDPREDTEQENVHDSTSPSDDVPEEKTSQKKEKEVKKRKFTYASEVVIEPVDWLWKKRIARGMLTLMVGDPGLGKSMTLMKIASAVSTGGVLPDNGKIEPGGVIVMAPEDSDAHTIVPRLVAAGADLTKIILLTKVTEHDKDGNAYERPISFPEDASILEEAIIDCNASLAIIDPVLAMISEKYDSHKDQSVRLALGRVTDVAEKHQCAVLGVVHLNKSQSGNALYRSSASIGFIGMARVGLFVVPDPDNERGGVIVNHKNNLADRTKTASLCYNFLETEEEIGYVEWNGASDYSQQELLNQSTPTDNKKSTQETDILNVLTENGAAMTLAQILPFTNQSSDALEKMLNRKVTQGILIKPARGMFTYNGNPLYSPTQAKQQEATPEPDDKELPEEREMLHAQIADKIQQLQKLKGKQVDTPKKTGVWLHDIGADYVEVDSYDRIYTITGKDILAIHPSGKFEKSDVYGTR